MTSLPDDLSRLKHLRIFFGSNNPFEEVPSALAGCKNLMMAGFKACEISGFDENALPPSLRWLVLTDNKIVRLPESMGDLNRLEKVSLTGNRLSSLPEAMQKCEEIQFLRISANAFEQEPPKWAFDLPKLAWYGDNGNPFSHSLPEAASSMPKISWHDIEQGETLGESPSSEVFKGVVKETKQEVAVKLYKGGLTSDGYPADDRKTFLAAGEHQNLVRIVGDLKDGPDGREGLKNFHDGWHNG